MDNNLHIPDERITWYNFMHIISQNLDEETMTRYLLRDLDRSQINHIFYKNGILAYYNNQFYNDLVRVI